MTSGLQAPLRPATAVVELGERSEKRHSVETGDSSDFEGSTDDESTSTSAGTSSSGARSEEEEDETDGGNQHAQTEDGPVVTSAPGIEPGRNAKLTEKSWKLADGSSALQTRLSTFLPQLKQANETLEADAEKQELRIDDVADDEENYIEMNLGLGVLKKKRRASDAVHFDVSSSDADSSHDEDIKETSPDATDVLNELHGLKLPQPKKRKIEEVL